MLLKSKIPEEPKVSEIEEDKSKIKESSSNQEDGNDQVKSKKKAK